MSRIKSEMFEIIRVNLYDDAETDSNRRSVFFRKGRAPQ